ncbi:MAG TPA: hypothetical protein DEG28_00960 [Porphyromonadaceae bacterium]|nr:hypothetical protein [Porphyromonadaceae bacterium]
MARLKRALSVSDIQSYKPTVLDFEGEWLASFGRPELTGAWLMWGPSFSGKTRMALQLAKYLARFERVAYNSLEEGLSMSMQEAIISVGMAEVSRNFILLDKEPISELKERLRRRKSPRVVIIDSVQYTGLTYSDYVSLKEEFRNKLFVFISHADGREPKGNVAKSIRYDAFVKISVRGYAAEIMSRFGGGEKFIIWQKGYDNFDKFN